MGAGAVTPVNAGDQLAILDEVIEISERCSFLSFFAAQGSKAIGCFLEGIWK